MSQTTKCLLECHYLSLVFLFHKDQKEHLTAKYLFLSESDIQLDRLVFIDPPSTHRSIFN